jgi:hypothetical protein
MRLGLGHSVFGPEKEVSRPFGSFEEEFSRIGEKVKGEKSDYSSSFEFRINGVLNLAQNGEKTANLRRAGCNLRSAKCQKARTFCPV